MYMKVLKKNQIIVFILAVMLVTAGYLTTLDQNNIESTIMANGNTTEGNTIYDNSSIGDAKLVNGGAIVENDDFMNSNVKETSEKNEQDDNYFAASRLDRDTMYSQQIDSYQKMIDSTTITNDQKAIAENEIKRINNDKNAIMIAENLIKTKGFDDIVVFINGDSINAVVKSKNLNQQDIALIQNILSRELNAEISNIHITNKRW